MAPLRRTMTDHGLPGWYAWVIVIVMTILLSGGAMALSIRSSKQAIEAERMARIESAENTRLATCSVVLAQMSAYREVPPVTAAGKKAAQALERLSVQLRCE